LLVEYFKQIPEQQAADKSKESKALRRAAVAAFRKRVAERYTEGTLLRLLESPHACARRAAVLALGLLGSMDTSENLADHLRDQDPVVCRMAVDALWSVWFRADSPENNEDLRRLARLQDPPQALARLDALIARAPDFAEAYNQRAIVHFRLKDYVRSLEDCERTLQLNPNHFAALAGMGKCFLQLRKHRAALRSFRQALRINPHLDGIAATVRTLEEALDEEGRRDDKK
jgi:tetratricopeptide (TPR) repeat protein